MAHVAETGLAEQMLHAHVPHAQGMTWVSRQFDTSRAAVLFGDRVADAVLDPVTPSLPLGVGDGLEEVMKRAERIEVTLSL